MENLVLKGNMYLGTLCKRGHDFNGQGLSLRYKKKGEAKGGLCVACNLAHCRTNTKNAKKEKARGGASRMVLAKCPMCEKMHKIIIKGGWIGNGTPRKYCKACKIKKNLLTNGAVDYGYAN